MNKKQLIEKTAKQTGVGKEETRTVIEKMLENIAEALEQQEIVRLVGFGMFTTRICEPRIGVDPRTKEKINIPETVVPTFHAGKALKDTVNHR